MEKSSWPIQFATPGSWSFQKVLQLSLNSNPYILLSFHSYSKSMMENQYLMASFYRFNSSFIIFRNSLFLISVKTLVKFNYCYLYFQLLVSFLFCSLGDLFWGHLRSTVVGILNTLRELPEVGDQIDYHNLQIFCFTTD